MRWEAIEPVTGKRMRAGHARAIIVEASIKMYGG